MIFVTYDPNQPYPQPALFGRGVVTWIPDLDQKGKAKLDSEGKPIMVQSHALQAGLASFAVDETTLSQGVDEALYEVTGSGTLAARAKADRDAILLTAAKPSALARIDEMAGDVRVMFITDVPGQSETYQVKAQQAQDFKDAGYPTNTTPYPFVQAKADANNLPPRAAADLILTTRDQWIALGASIERERELGKANVSGATTAAQVDAYRDAAIAAMQALIP